tara:strand:+ start:80 stop:517 length:438 start_codon:yes stop_codon:yes gene_type:complete
MAAPIDHAWAILKAIPMIDYSAGYNNPNVGGGTPSTYEGDMNDPNMLVGSQIAGAGLEHGEADFAESLPTFPLRRREALGRQLDNVGHFDSNHGIDHDTPLLAAFGEASRRAAEAGVPWDDDLIDAINQRYRSNNPYMGRMRRPQ